MTMSVGIRVLARKKKRIIADLPAPTSPKNRNVSPVSLKRARIRARLSSWRSDVTSKLTLVVVVVVDGGAVVVDVENLKRGARALSEHALNNVRCEVEGAEVEAAVLVRITRGRFACKRPTSEVHMGQVKCGAPSRVQPFVQAKRKEKERRHVLG